MFTLSGLTLLAGIWFSQGCPASLQVTDTSVGAISNSAELTLCVSRSTLIRGSDGKLKLVLNANQSAPTCLIYPNGLSPDLSYDLISKGYRGCWSLYPPSEPIAIVNVGKAPRIQLSSAFKSFKPSQPRILVSPTKNLLVGDTVLFSHNARSQVVSGVLLGLPAQVRFTPKTYLWQIGQLKSKLAKQSYQLSVAGQITANLVVGFGLEYKFPGLSAWATVQPNIKLNAPTVQLNVTQVPVEPPRKRIPRLVDQPCGIAPRWGC